MRSRSRSRTRTSTVGVQTPRSRILVAAARFFLHNSVSVAFCRHTVGDTKVPFCLQSCVKPLKYAVAIHDHSTEYVHSFIGKEPSGLRFNKLFLNDDGERLVLLSTRLSAYAQGCSS